MVDPAGAEDGTLVPLDPQTGPLPPVSKIELKPDNRCSSPACSEALTENATDGRRRPLRAFLGLPTPKSQGKSDDRP